MDYQFRVENHVHGANDKFTLALNSHMLSFIIIIISGLAKGWGVGGGMTPNFQINKENKSKKYFNLLRAKYNKILFRMQKMAFDLHSKFFKIYQQNMPPGPPRRLTLWVIAKSCGPPNLY